MTTSLLSLFKNPGAAYRAKPFWAWNGKLEEGELRRQIRLMHRMGLGGFFMHSRVGLDTPYLQPEWFSLINACADEAKKLGMEAWLYDEDRWPSGAAGGIVTKDPRYRMRYVLMEEVDRMENLPRGLDILGVFSGRRDGHRAADVTFIGRGRVRPARAPKGGKLFVFHVITEPTSSWYNGYTYLDTMSHEAVREFIRVTHEVYRQKCGTYLGSIIPGIFTDEPNHGCIFNIFNEKPGAVGIPWTPRLPAIFKRRYGYDLIPHLMEVYISVDAPAVSPARYHYHECTTHLFVDAFARQIGEWCAKNKVAHTGHVLCEDSLAKQTEQVGDCMRFYEYMQAPGMDLLTEHWRVYATAKQVSSVARQFGRPWRLTETYGCTGWDFPFEGHKALGDWQMALGINLRCQHLVWYTMEGEAKRDYPASISYQSPWWQEYTAVENYFARINTVMTRGTEVRDVLVLHPVESMWLMYHCDWGRDQKLREFDRMFHDLTAHLLSHQLDFDYGNEVIMARHATVVRGRNGVRLRVGKAEYKVVLIPAMKTMRKSTLALLKAFKAAGGQVVFTDNSPTLVEAKPSPALLDFVETCVKVPLRGTPVIKAVEPFCRRVAILDGRGAPVAPALYLLREDHEAAYLFICNTSETATQQKGEIFHEVMVRERPLSFPEVKIVLKTDAKGQGRL